MLDYRYLSGRLLTDRLGNSSANLLTSIDPFEAGTNIRRCPLLFFGYSLVFFIDD